MSTKGVTVSVDVPAPVEDVWSELASIQTHVEWMADAVAIEFHGAQREGVGTRFSCRTAIGPLRTTDEMEITEWTPLETMGVRHSGAVTGVGRFTLAPGPHGTTSVSWHERLEFPWWMGGPIGAWAARPIFRWIWGRNLERLSKRVTARS